MSFIRATELFDRERLLKPFYEKRIFLLKRNRKRGLETNLTVGLILLKKMPLKNSRTRWECGIAPVIIFLGRLRKMLRSRRCFQFPLFFFTTIRHNSEAICAIWDVDRTVGFDRFFGLFRAWSVTLFQIYRRWIASSRYRGTLKEVKGEREKGRPTDRPAERLPGVT